MDASIRDQVLASPEVQQALSRAGEQALKDPVVQQQVADTIKEKFPEYAASAHDSALAWASDPEAQERAKKFAGVAAAAATTFVGNVGTAFMTQIEQGPKGVRMLAFCGGAASVGVGVMHVLNPMEAILTPHVWVIAIYLLCFSLTTMLFEIPPQWNQSLSFLNLYHDYVIDQAKFLTQVRGRGYFYIFQGTLWLSMASRERPLTFFCGLYMIFIGLLHVAMHYGIMPKQIAEKAKEKVAAGVAGVQSLELVRRQSRVLRRGDSAEASGSLEGNNRA